MLIESYELEKIFKQKPKPKFFHEQQEVANSMRLNYSQNLNSMYELQIEYKKLKDQMTSQKLHLNMIVHDLRSPAESIYQGLKKSQEIVESKMNNLISSIIHHAQLPLRKSNLSSNYNKNCKSQNEIIVKPINHKYRRSITVQQQVKLMNIIPSLSLEEAAGELESENSNSEDSAVLEEDELEGVALNLPKHIAVNQNHQVLRLPHLENTSEV